jgi:hypothetical protein
MKVGKIYYCYEDKEWVQASSERSVNSVCLIEGVKIGFEMDLSYYDGRLTEVPEGDKKWFLECIIAEELVDRKESSDLDYSEYDLELTFLGDDTSKCILLNQYQLVIIENLADVEMTSGNQKVYVINRQRFTIGPKM